MIRTMILTATIAAPVAAAAAALAAAAAFPDLLRLVLSAERGVMWVSAEAATWRGGVCQMAAA